MHMLMDKSIALNIYYYTLSSTCRWIFACVYVRIFRLDKTFSVVDSLNETKQNERCPMQCGVVWCAAKCMHCIKLNESISMSQFQSKSEKKIFRDRMYSDCDVECVCEYMPCSNAGKMWKIEVVSQQIKCEMCGSKDGSKFFRMVHFLLLQQHTM